jgi:glycosyltransferase involved in cell wall biosynthesis
MISVYVMSYNEERLMAHFVEHYRERFPGCRVVVHDNMSTDSTAAIAADVGCEVVTYDSHDEVDDQRLTRWKNNVWKGASTSWVLVCDTDELLEIDASALAEESARGTTLIRSAAWNMVSERDGDPPQAVTRGVRAPVYDKTLLFDRTALREINYGLGAHAVAPVGRVKVSETEYRLWHMRYMDEEQAVVRQRYTARRMSPENILLGLGAQYMSGEDEVRAQYRQARAASIPIRRARSGSSHPLGLPVPPAAVPPDDAAR